MPPLDLFLYIFPFVFGTIIGSFLNVVTYRFHTGVSIGGRSRCLSCGVKLSPCDLIPLASFIFSRARCRSCTSRLSWQYPLVELSAGALTALVVWKFLPLGIFSPSGEIGRVLLYLAIVYLLILIAVYDLRHKIIPNLFVYSFVVLAFVVCLAVEDFSWSDLFAGPLFFLAFASVWYFSSGRWMGLGDAKLALGIGFLLGFAAGLDALLLAFSIGGAVSLLLLSLRRTSITLKSEIPFAPFLILGALIEFFVRIPLLLFS